MCGLIVVYELRSWKRFARQGRKILYNLSISHLSREIWQEKIKHCFIVDSCHYPWGYVDESDIAKDDEYGNIVSMVVIVVVGYILSRYLKSVVACARCICYLYHIHKICPKRYTVQLFTVEFLDAENVIWPSWPQIAGHKKERYSYIIIESEWGLNWTWWVIRA